MVYKHNKSKNCEKENFQMAYGLNKSKENLDQCAGSGDKTKINSDSILSPVITVEEYF